MALINYFVVFRP